MPTERLPRASILRRRSDFSRVRAKGRRVMSRVLMLNWLREKGEQQMAVITPKHVGNAVQRNKIKRRIREVYRKMQNRLPENLKSVWIARRPAADVVYLEVQEEMTKLYRKAGLLGKE